MLREMFLGRVSLCGDDVEFERSTTCFILDIITKIKVSLPGLEV